MKFLCNIINFLWVFVFVLVFALLLFSLLAPFVKADEGTIDAGLGVFSTEGKSLSQVKFLKVGLEKNLWYSLKQKFGAGGWLDTRGMGRTNSGFATYQLGFQVQNEVFEASIFSGPALISTPDTALGGPLQFNETLYFGLVDKSGESIGISYNHFSSAGIEMPNLGRDFMSATLKLPF